MLFSKIGDGVSVTGNLNLAVALATFGYPHELRRHRDEPSGTVFSSLWYFGCQAILYVKSNPEERMPAVTSNVLKRMVMDGTLQAEDPAHPVLDVLHPINIFECLRTYMERGTEFKIVQTSPGRATLTAGHEPASDLPRPAIRTDSIDLAVALIRVGIPLLACEGIAPHRRIVLAATGYDLGQGPVDAAAHAQSINDGALQKTDPAHPSLWALVGLKNRRSMKKELKDEAMPLLLRNPRSLAWERRRKSFIMHGVQNGSAIDRARRDL